MKMVLAVLALVLSGVMLIVLCVGFVVTLQAQQAQQQAGDGAFSSIADAALSLQDHIFGTRANEYDDRSDPFMQKVMKYWTTSCVTDGKMCEQAMSGQLQCVEFVTAVQWLAGDPLTVIRNAQDFWPAYATTKGWTEIPSPSSFPTAALKAPALGDLMIWKGGRHLEKQQDGSMKEVEYGHIAVVVGFQAPSGGHNGTVTVAEGNAPGNKWQPFPSPKAGNTYTMPVHPDYTVDTWNAYTDAQGVRYGPYAILGYLHHDALPPAAQMLMQAAGPDAQTLPTGLSFNTPYVREAWNDAIQAGIPPGYYVRQINQESGFNPSVQSSVGAQGIAQIMPSTAAGIPNPLGPGTLNPWEPHQALIAGARYMAAAVQRYGGEYAKALAAYNGGDGEVLAAEQAAESAKNGSTWLDYLVPETRNYIKVITGI